MATRPPPPWKLVERRERAEARARGVVLPPLRRSRSPEDRGVVPAAPRPADVRVPPKGPRERVTAAELRPDDWLVTNEGPLRITDLQVDGAEVRVRTNGRWWSCRPSTRFLRVQVRSSTLEVE